eukprot:scaffold19639_cov65-Phaeocystis_antarctica.AAC.7
MPCPSETQPMPLTSGTWQRSSTRLYTCAHARSRVSPPSSSGKRKRPLAAHSTGCHSVSSRCEVPGSVTSTARPPAHGVSTTQRTAATPPSAVRTRSPPTTASRRVAPLPSTSTVAHGAKQPPPRMYSAGSAAGGAYEAEPAACRSASIGVGGASVAKASSAASLSSQKSASRPCKGGRDQPIAYDLPPTADCLLLTAYCLLLTAHCLLLTIGYCVPARPCRSARGTRRGSWSAARRAASPPACGSSACPMRGGRVGPCRRAPRLAASCSARPPGWGWG